MTAAADRALAGAYENPRPEVQALVPRSAKRLLDLGCSSGALSAQLKARQELEVVGVELDADYARTAGKRLDRVLTADVQELAARPDLEADLGRFDALIAADILEHLVDPWSALATFAALLEPGGTAVVSVPNVRHWETFWMLGRYGTWPRRSVGVFDRTHLRWFTLADAQELLAQAGLRVVAVERQYRLRGDRPTPGWDARVAALGRGTPLRPFVAFQNVLAGTREGA